MCAKKFVCLSRSLILFLPHQIPTPSDRTKPAESWIAGLKVPTGIHSSWAFPERRVSLQPNPTWKSKGISDSSLCFHQAHPTQRSEQAHAWERKTCHLCLPTEMQIIISERLIWTAPTSFIWLFRKLDVWPAVPRSQSEFFTCVSSFCCFEEVITNNCFHML